MANQEDIRNYLVEDANSYLNRENSNGKILMLSGVWGSGKTHFWKNEIEKNEKLLENLKDKSYVYISLYGKDSIEELQNEIQNLSYNFSKTESKSIISTTFSVFTKVTSFMPAISLSAFGVGVKVNPEKTIKKIEDANIRQQIQKGVGRLKDGGIVCFDDFERKSSKIDLNDLFGFITNLTEEFQTKTIIITNQEFFKENDSEIFSRIKEKSVNKFLLLNPTVDEFFETIYKDKYTELDEYKDTILEAIKVTEEKNARIFIQVLDNCLEYKDSAENQNDIFMLVLITIVFVKYNLIFRMENISVLRGMGSEEKFLPNIVNNIPTVIAGKISTLQSNSKITKAWLLDRIRRTIELKNENKKEENLKEDLKYLDMNKDVLFQIYKYCIETEYFTEEKSVLIEKLNNFVESGIL